MPSDDIASIASSLAKIAAIKEARSTYDFMTPIVLGSSLVVMVGFGLAFKKMFKYMDDNNQSK